MTAIDSADGPISWRKRATSALVSTATLAALVGIGIAGHATHWTFGLGAHAAHSEHGDQASGHAEPGHGQDTAAKADRTHSGQAVSSDSAVSGSPDSATGRTVASGESSNVLKFESPGAFEKAGIEIVPIRVRSMGETIRANGMIDFDQHHVARVSGIVSGKVSRVQRRLGDSVKKGEVLALIESVQVGEAKARFLTALAISQTRDETVRILESVSTIIAQRQLREAKLTAQEARIELLNAEQTLSNLGLKLSIEEFAKLSEVERTARIRFLGLPESIGNEIRTTQLTSNLIPLTAPFDGIVIGRDVGLGEVVEPARPLFEVADVSRMWIVLNVRKEDAYKLRLGQTIRFQGDGLKDPVESKVSWIASEVDEIKRSLVVRGEIPNRLRTDIDSDSANFALKAKTFGTGVIEVGGKADALVVPREAVHDDGGKRYVFLQENDRTFRAIEVKTGLEDSEDVEILSELPREGRLAGRGSHVLKSQMLLQKIDSGES